MPTSKGQRKRRATPPASASAQRDRRKAQQAVASARRGGSADRRWIIIGAVVVVLLAAGVVGGVLYQQHQNTQATKGDIPLAHASGKYPTTIDRAAATVLVGKDSAKTTVDAYEDFLCPICGQFEQTYFPGIEKHLAAGDIKVRYHLLNLLDDRSNPAGYSTQSANTALAIATVAPDKFLDFHYSLYQKQPKEGGAGWTQLQLTDLANRLGVTGSQFDSLVQNKTYDAQIQKNLTTAENDKSLWQDNGDGSKGFGTPTVVVNGKTVDWRQSDWLDKAVAGS
jgi:protein-disulfide isomerase